MSGLSHAIDYNASAPERMNEYENIVYRINLFAKEMLEKKFMLEKPNAIKSALTSDMETHMKTAIAEINAIKATVEANKERQKHIHRELLKEGFYDWRDRSFVVASYGNRASFMKINPNNPDMKYDIGKPVWVIDNNAVYEAFAEDFKKCLPENVPKDAFSYQVYRDSTSPGTKGDSMLVSFNQAYEHDVKETFVKLT